MAKKKNKKKRIDSSHQKSSKKVVNNVEPEAKKVEKQFTQDKKDLVYRVFVFFIATIIFSSTFVYIFVAIKDFYPENPLSKFILHNKQSENTKERTMNGIEYIWREHPGDYNAILWINENIKGQPVILEEVGDAYTYSARISSTTGLPTVIGWPTHEWQWRGSPDTPFQRKTEVENFYKGINDTDTDYKFLKEYEIAYIYVGDKEHTTYPELNEDRIKSYGKVVYDRSNTFIVEVSDMISGKE